MALHLAKEIVEKENIAQAANKNYCPKKFWVCVTPTDQAVKHTAALVSPNQKEQRRPTG
tara:strand:+ start:1458 stop:1634 length:177 start_codon:yes stop_codon:yes gene_type:complete